MWTKLEPKCKVIEDPTGPQLAMSTTTTTPRDLSPTEISQKTRRVKPTDPGDTRTPRSPTQTTNGHLSNP